MRPITAAARARSRIAGPRTWPMGRPTIPARRNTARNARTVASTHTTVCSRRTGTPSDAARSARSAPARIAIPMSLRRRNSAERDEHDGHDRQRDDVGAAEHDWADRHVHVEGRRDRRAGEREVAGEEQRAGGEHLGDPDRGDAEDQAWGVREAAHEQQLDRGADQQRDGEAGDECHPPVQGDGADHQQDGQRCRDGAEVAGREVDDPVGAPDQRDAERDERRQRADDRTLDDHAGGDVPRGDGEDQDRDRDRGGAGAPHGGHAR